jgi:hypothetical protein
LQIRQLEAVIRKLGEDVIEEGRHANEHVRFDFADQPQIAIGAHDFAAAGTEHKDAESGARIMRNPKGRDAVRMERGSSSHFAVRVTNSHDARAGELQIRDVVSGVEEWHRCGRASRGARQKQRTKLALEAFNNSFASAAAVPWRWMRAGVTARFCRGRGRNPARDRLHRFPQENHFLW